jgi:hypothetical protein
MNHKGKIAAAIVGVEIVTIAALPLFVNVKTFRADAAGTTDDNTSSTN